MNNAAILVAKKCLDTNQKNVAQGCQVASVAAIWAEFSRLGRKIQKMTLSRILAEFVFGLAELAENLAEFGLIVEKLLKNAGNTYCLFEWINC